ncbi:glycosyltransferase [Flexivirga meconopsidis]|uniref:glycosyltransferase n=1 Tax=Flexivirga meconopsidis TaxID=2977121 RepID=UPI003CC5359A
MLRARLVVDAFVGMHETNVGDWGEVPVTSVRARLYAAFDKIAVRVADLTLTDTEVRARRWKEHGARDVSVVPVGAPDWASPTRAPETGPLQVLYYGNYIPLHGLDYVASAMTFLTDRTIEWTFIGNGSERPLIESQLRRAADGMPTRFLDHVSTYELARHIKESHVVLGVFGLSEKAGSVIANKVWQGLAGGRVVITRSSDALRELTFVSVDQLIQVDPECATDLAAQLDRLSRAHSTGELDTFTETSEWLETYVNSRASAVVQSLAERMLERGEGRTLR